MIEETSSEINSISDHKEYEIRNTGTSPYKGNDIGVYEKGSEELLRGFNTLSNDYAYTAAKDYITFLKTKSWDHI